MLQLIFIGRLMCGELLGSFICLQTNRNQEQVVKQVPDGFSYPESPQLIEMRTTFSVKSVSGIVTDDIGTPMPKVLVEQVTPDWKKRLNATFTDFKGCFEFANLPKGKYYLKLSKPGFDTLLVKITTTKQTKRPLKLKLHPSS